MDGAPLNPRVDAHAYAYERAAEEELNFADQWDDPDYDYADLSTRLMNVPLHERGAKWWEAAYNGYIDHRDNYARVTRRMQVLRATSASGPVDRARYRKLNNRQLRMWQSKHDVFKKSGINPATAFGAKPTLTDFYEVGRQQLRVHLHERKRQIQPGMAVHQFANEAGPRRAALLAPATRPEGFPENKHWDPEVAYDGHDNPQLQIGLEQPGFGIFANVVGPRPRNPGAGSLEDRPLPGAQM